MMLQAKLTATQLQAISKAATQSLMLSSLLSQEEMAHNNVLLDNAKMAERYLKVRSIRAKAPMAAMDLEHISINCETALGFDALIDAMPSPLIGHMKRK